jgi:hypothetical protein
MGRAFGIVHDRSMRLRDRSRLFVLPTRYKVATSAHDTPLPLAGVPSPVQSPSVPKARR